ARAEAPPAEEHSRDPLSQNPTPNESPPPQVSRSKQLPAPLRGALPANLGSGTGGKRVGALATLSGEEPTPALVGSASMANEKPHGAESEQEPRKGRQDQGEDR
ncbi:hypothetical protein ACFL59_16465, partial [Planctomycetota bacterium]